MHSKYLFVPLPHLSNNQIQSVNRARNSSIASRSACVDRRVAMTFSDAVQNEEASDAQRDVAYQRRALSHTGRANVSLSGGGTYLFAGALFLCPHERAGFPESHQHALSASLPFLCLSLSLFLLLSPILTRLT